MSMESALDEERLGVLALLEGSSEHNPARRAPGGSVRRSLSPVHSLQSPIRSMLDVDKASMLRQSSIAGNTSEGITTPSHSGSIRSMLDVGDSPSHSSSAHSVQTLPTETSFKTSRNSNVHSRSLSDTAARAADFGSQLTTDRALKADRTSDYRFSGYLPSSPGASVSPKRNILAGKLPSAFSSAMLSSVGGDSSNLLPRDRSRHHSVSSGISTTGISKSPHNRLALPSSSPHSSAKYIGPSNHMNNSAKIELDDGRMVDRNSAYRRLSDANLALSGSSLASLTRKSDLQQGNNKDVPDLEKARLEKDYSYLAEEDAVAESSDEYELDSSDEEAGRGRKKISANVDRDIPGIHGSCNSTDSRQAHSLLAAAEEERNQVVQQGLYKVRSLLEPEITVTSPGGDRGRSSKPVVHPANSFDQNVSSTSTPLDSDTEADITDIKRAQKLAVIMTPVISTPVTNRCVRTIYRGDFAKMQQEARDDQRRVRKYLVATDLSDEAQHALEWTVGTVLRDGDTLLAIYCVDEEIGIGEATVISERVLSDQVSSIAATTNSPQQINVPSSRQMTASPLGNLLGSNSSPNRSPAGIRSRAEQERHRAVQDITDRVSKLLRKTRLQVRVVIEVIHCKSPKHLITEVIDYINPTLVILGSRGRSALKGVILGSFSNYLVTKSSVPVMVARKRLRKHGKYKRPAVRLANNLTNLGSRNLASAKID